MNQLVNKNLITLKCVLFCFLSGIGCIFPFLSMHMLSVGLNRAESRLISTIAPCVALLGPALLGPLIDKLSVGRGSTGGSNGPSGSGRLLRTITAICLILSAIFYSLLLTVPYTERHDANRTSVLFMCDKDGAYVMQEVCKESESCSSWDSEKSGVLALGTCEYICADTNKTWMLEKFPEVITTTTQNPVYNSVANSTHSPILEDDDEDDEAIEHNPPHLCYDGTCDVSVPYRRRMRISIGLLSSSQHNSTDKWCTYVASRKAHCDVPVEKLNKLHITDGCKPSVRCQVLDPYDEPEGVLADAECKKTKGDPTSTFWSYFFVRILSDIWPTAALALLGTACVIATRETSLGRGDVGRQLAVGTVGLAIFPPLAGYAAQQMPEDPYLVPFVMHAVFMLIGAVILLLDKNMPLSTPEWWWHTATGVLTMPMNVVRRYGAETAAVAGVVTLLGILWSGIDVYLPWTIFDLKGNLTETGLTMTIGAVPAIPALWWAEAVVDYIGHSNVFIMAFTFYGVRYVGMAYSEDYAWVLVCEVLEVFTLSLVWVTAVLYFRHLVPRKYTATGQALPVIAHFCIGRCIGAIVSGLVSLEHPLWSLRRVYRGLGATAILVAAVYLALYHLLLAPRCASPAQAPPPQLLQGLNSSNGTSNGTRSPMRVYHEERSKKGHFRY